MLGAVLSVIVVYSLVLFARNIIQRASNNDPKASGNQKQQALCRTCSLRQRRQFRGNSITSLTSNELKSGSSSRNARKLAHMKAKCWNCSGSIDESDGSIKSRLDYGKINEQQVVACSGEDRNRGVAFCGQAHQDKQLRQSAEVTLSEIEENDDCPNTRSVSLEQDLRNLIKQQQQQQQPESQLENNSKLQELDGLQGNCSIQTVIEVGTGKQEPVIDKGAKEASNNHVEAGESDVTRGKWLRTARSVLSVNHLVDSLKQLAVETKIKKQQLKSQFYFRGQPGFTDFIADDFDEPEFLDARSLRTAEVKM